MSYDTLEQSAAQGRPVELYTFSRGSIAWRFTSADRDIVDVQTYKAEVISRGPIEQGSETIRSSLTLNVAHTFAIAELYKIAPPSDVINLLLRQYHYGDAEFKTIWQGEIVSVGFAGGDAEIALQPLASNMSTTGLRRCYQKSCPFVLYGADCTVNPAAFRTTGNVVVVSGLTVTVLEAASKPDGFFDGGYLEWQISGSEFERRFIKTHIGTDILVDVIPLDLGVGASARLYPGCDHSLATCNSKFSNVLNYGGMPYIPNKNPFGSDPIF